MPHHLPPDLITRIKPLLMPYVQDKDERRALFVETFFLRDPRPLDQINFEGSADVFSTHCIADLIAKIGCLAETGTHLHSLAALLLTVRARCGVEKHSEIDHWTPILNNECAMPSIQPPPPAPISQPVQTAATPQAERRPSVFISYSHGDTDFANQLIGDLQAEGYACWIDVSGIKGGADWQRAICDGINNSYALVVVCTGKALQSEYVWDEIQWARTRRKLIVPALLEDVTNDDRFFGLHRYQGIHFDTLPYTQALAGLLAALPTPPHIDPAQPPRMPTRREYELAYLDRLRFEDFRLEKFELAEYASLPGVAQARQTADDAWGRLAMRQEFAVIREGREGAEVEGPPEAFTDAVSRITELRRVVVLGDPGAGKTHTLRALAKPLYTAALSDPDAPIPLLVKLGNWDDPAQPFEAFLREALGELGAHLEALFAAKRAVLLFDGLNEFPADQRKAKYPQVEAFIAAHPACMAVVTCREADYPFSLRLHKVLIRPLDVFRIRDFADRALRPKGEGEGEVFFWKLGGGEALRRVWEKWESAGATFLQFWTAPDIPRENPNVHGATSGADDYLWRRHIYSAGSLMGLASNPYMLRMLLDVYIQFRGDLPSNRGKLFDQFVNVLLKREKLAHIDAATNAVTLTDEGQALLASLRQIAYQMQMRRGKGTRKSRISAGTSLPSADIQSILDERLLYLAVSTSILNSGDEVRFSHQLLQEYFAARYMDEALRAGTLKAADLWKPETWWERTNWEEAVVLLAGLYSDDCTPVLDWVEAANPEVAAQCILRSGAAVPEPTLKHLQAGWMPRLTDIQREPRPQARAAVGRALGLIRLDNRPGVLDLNWDEDYWCHVPAGEFHVGSDQDSGNPKRIAKIYYDFWIARYPVTYAQFQLFIDAPDGYRNYGWWKGLHEDGLKQQRSGAGEQRFKFWNHPRESVSWYEAVAFCRWVNSLPLALPQSLSLKGRGRSEYEIRLPLETEWEKAAAWDAKAGKARVYSWGDEFDPTRANTSKGFSILQTTCVGIYPQGAAPCGAQDQIGNVLEWCLNEHSGEMNLSSRKARGLRGGSWSHREIVARAAYRNARAGRRGYFSPEFRRGNVGFRLAASVLLLSTDDV